MSDSTTQACPDCNGSGKRDALHRGTNEVHSVRCACQHELPIKFVYQPETTGCCIAAIAMIVGQSYFDVKQLLHIEHDLACEGLSRYPVDEIFDYYGFAVQRRFRHSNRLKSERAGWPCAPWADLHWCEVINTRASGQHAVVLLRDGRVLDPWWGVLQGLHRYPEVVSMAAVYRIRAVDVPGLGTVEIAQ